MSILNSALEYLDLNFSVIPIRPGPEKKPFIPWTEFQKRRASEEEVEGWFQKWPGANIAIITGSISGVFVVDGDGEIGSRWIYENCPKTSVYAKTGRVGGCHCFYRIPPGVKIPNKVGWKPKVDIRGEGGYVIAPPSIHHTGNTYSWIFREGLNGWSDLAEFNPAKMGGNLMLDLRNVKLPGENLKGVEQGSRNATLASMVGKLLSDGSTPDFAWEFITAWNARNTPPLGEKEVKTTFRSILKKHEAGTPIKIESVPVIVSTEPEPEPELTETDKEIFGDKTDSYPVECLQPGGLLQEIMEYTEKSSASHKPIFALSAAISLLGNVLGQRVMTETGLRTNMYCVSIGYSGAGKNASHSTIASILGSSNARLSMGPTDTASGVALLKWLTTDSHQVSLFTFDEFGMLLQGTKNPASPMAELPRILTKIFSSTDRPEIKSYADSKLNITVPWHHLSLYASSTPSKFWGNLSEADTISGFLARILIFEAHDEIEKTRNVVKSTVPKSIIDQVNALWAISPPIDKERGDIARVPVPFVVPRSQDAAVLFDSWADKYWELRNKYREDDAKSAVYGRAAEHAAKLALIHSASLKGGKIVSGEIDSESVEWATKITDSCIKELLTGISRNISKNQFHAEQQRIIKFLLSRSGEAPAREVYRRLHVPSRQFNELIVSMNFSGEIRQENRKNSKGLDVSWIILNSC